MLANDLTVTNSDNAQRKVYKRQTKMKIEPHLVERCKILIQQQPTQMWAKHNFKLPHLYDYINSFAVGEKYSFARYKLGEKADVEVLRVLLTIKDETTNEDCKNEAIKLIDEFAIIDRAMQATVNPQSIITFFAVGAYYEAYDNEAEYLAKQFNLPIFTYDIKSKSVKFVSVNLSDFFNLKINLMHNGITVSIFNEWELPIVTDELM